jgi:signal transduction histidine kinase
MTSFSNNNPMLRRMLRYAEWALILMVLLLYWIDHHFYQIQELPSVFPQAAIFCVFFFILSFIFPIDRSRLQRRLYVFVEVMLILIAQLSWVQLDVLLYFILIKSCFFLSRREVIFAVVATGVGYVLSISWSIQRLAPKMLEAIQSASVEEMYKPQALIMGSLISYIGISLFVVLLGFLIVAERQSRQKAEMLSREIETLAATLERSRIARDIHDSLGHALTTLNIQLQLAQAVSQRDPNHAAQALSNAQKLATQCLESVRQAVQTVRQQEFDLSVALERLIGLIQQTQTLTIHADLYFPTLPLPTSHQLYCIVQEGLTNIQKHAQASQVKLTSQVQSQNLVIALEDNGKGFDPSASYSGYGLKGMYERVNLLGGRLSIDSVLERGTVVEVVIPI